MLKKGDPAPEFELLNAEGRPVKLASFRGQRVVLFFYPKAATPGCTIQACGFRDNFPKIEAANATVVGVSPDKPAALARWKAAENLPYTLLSDPEHVVAEAYGAWGERSMYGRDFMGIIRSHFVIDAEGILEDVQVKISPADSISQAMAVLAGRSQTP